MQEGDKDKKGELLQHLYDPNKDLEIIFDYASLLPCEDKLSLMNSEVHLGGSQISLAESKIGITWEIFVTYKQFRFRFETVFLSLHIRLVLSNFSPENISPFGTGVNSVG